MKIAAGAGMRNIGLSLLMLGLAGCVSHGPAPVIDRTPARAAPPPVAAKAEPVRPVTPQIAPSTNGLHTVQRGDTVYAIAFANSLDHREIANWNQLESADRILVGQVLRLTSPPAVAAPVMSADATTESWLWPADGTLAGRFGAAGGKGIDIAGTRNSAVKAVAPGKVVYSGSGLRGYGQLLIVKHAGEFLSAYAHNETILVKEGDTVAAGQNIARMGDSDSDRVKLHFEIRRYGKPLDPLNYLPERS